MRKANLNFQSGASSKKPAPSRGSLPANAKMSQPLKGGAHSTATTAKGAMAHQNESGLAELVDECERFMERLEKDKNHRSVRDDDFSGAGLEDMDMAGADEDSEGDSDDSGVHGISAKRHFGGSMQVDEVSRPPQVVEESDDQLSQLLSANTTGRQADLDGEDALFESDSGFKVKAQSQRPQIFNSYLEGQTHSQAMFKNETDMLRQAHGQSVIGMTKQASQAVPESRQLHEGLPKSKSTMDEFEAQVKMLQEKLLMNQMPSCGNLVSSKRKEVKARIKCISALLQAREKAWHMKEQFAEKMRRLEMDKDIQEKKVGKLQKELLDMDRKKYQAELKAQESATSMRQMQKQTQSGVKELIGHQSSTEQKLLKSELDLKKAEKQIEKLQEQLRYNLSKHNSANFNSAPTSEVEQPPKRSMQERPRGDTEAEKLRMQQQLDRLGEQNERLKSAIVRMTNSINSGVTKTLIEPLNRAAPLIAQQVAQACNFSVEAVSRQSQSPMRLTQHTTVDQLWNRVSETIARMQKVHASALSVPTLLKVVESFNDASRQANRNLIMTVDDLKGALGLEPTEGEVPITIVQTIVPQKTGAMRQRNVKHRNAAMSPDFAEATVSARAMMKAQQLQQQQPRMHNFTPKIAVPAISLNDLSNNQHHSATPSQPVGATGPRMGGRSKSRAKWMPISERKSENQFTHGDADFDPAASVASSFYLPAEPQSARSRSRGSNM